MTDIPVRSLASSREDHLEDHLKLNPKWNAFKNSVPGDFEVAGAAAAARAAAIAASQPADADLAAIALLTTTSFGRSLLTLADAAAGRTALALGSSATQSSAAFDAAGAAAAAQAASQPVDSDLTAISALATTVFGRSFLALADDAAGRTLLGLGSAATQSSSAFDASGAAAAAQAVAVQRGNHAGVQAVATVSGLQASLDAKVLRPAEVAEDVGKVLVKDPTAPGTVAWAESGFTALTTESGELLTTEDGELLIAEDDITIPDVVGLLEALAGKATPAQISAAIAALSGTYVAAPPVGPPQSLTFTVDDVADPDSWYGPAAVRILPTWTPTVSGSVVLSLGPDNGDSDYADGNFDVYIWKGDVANVDYPDLTAAPFVGGLYAEVYSPTALHTQFRVSAGQPYTVTLVDWAGSDAVDHSMDLAGVLNSLYSFGGLEDPPPPLPLGGLFTAVTGPNGPAWRPYDPGTSGAGVDSRAEGRATQATGIQSHAEGIATEATQQASHAEGISTRAIGSAGHAEGSGSRAGDSAHAEGVYTNAAAWGSHTQGFFAHAFRTGESAESSGSFGTYPNNKAAQTSRVTMAVETTDSAPTAMVLGLGGGSEYSTPFLPLRGSTLSTVSVSVAARLNDGSAAKAWTITAAIDQAGGTARIVDTVTPAVVAADAGASAWDIDVTVDGPNAVFTVTGADASTIRWVAGIEIVEVRFA